MPNPEISVIIPTWNRAGDLQRAVESVLSQTFQDFEILVADDGSNDETPLVFEHYLDARVRYLRLAHSGLPAVARNAALREARGRWVAFLDSDDVWLPEKLQKQIDVIRFYPDVGLVCSNAWRNKGETSPLSHFHPLDLKSQPYFFERLLESNLVITSSVLVRKDLIDTLGGFPEKRIYWVAEDYHLWLRVALKTALYYLAEPLLIYTDTGASIRSLQSQEDNARGILRVMDDLLIHFPNETRPYQAAINQQRREYLKRLMSIHVQQGRLKDWKESLVRRWRMEGVLLDFHEYLHLLRSLVQLYKNKDRPDKL